VSPRSSSVCVRVRARKAVGLGISARENCLEDARSLAAAAGDWPIESKLSPFDLPDRELRTSSRCEQKKATRVRGTPGG